MGPAVGLTCAVRPVRGGGGNPSCPWRRRKSAAAPERPADGASASPRGGAAPLAPEGDVDYAAVYREQFRQEQEAGQRTLRSRIAR